MQLQRNLYKNSITVYFFYYKSEACASDLQQGLSKVHCSFFEANHYVKCGRDAQRVSRQCSTESVY